MRDRAVSSRVGACRRVCLCKEDLSRFLTGGGKAGGFPSPQKGEGSRASCPYLLDLVFSFKIGVIDF